MYSITARRIISGLALKYLKEEGLVIPKRYANPLPRSRKVLLTRPSKLSWCRCGECLNCNGFQTRPLCRRWNGGLNQCRGSHPTTSIARSSGSVNAWFAAGLTIDWDSRFLLGNGQKDITERIKFSYSVDNSSSTICPRSRNIPICCSFSSRGRTSITQKVPTRLLSGSARG